MTESLTDPAELDALEKMCDAATPGPRKAYFSRDGRWKYGTPTVPDDNGRADAELDAAAREALPRAIETIRALMDLLKRTSPHLGHTGPCLKWSGGSCTCEVRTVCKELDEIVDAYRKAKGEG